MHSRLNYLKERIVNNSEAVLIFLLIIFFVSEAISKISILSHLEKPVLQPAIKFLLLALILVGLIVYKKKELIYLFVLTVIFIIGQLTIPNGFELSTGTYFLKYIFPIAFFGFFKVQQSKPKLNLLNVFEYILILHSVVIIVGFLFEIPLFRTYSGNRFGYNGLLITSATSTYFYIFGMCYFLSRYQRKMINNWRFWLIALAGLLTGTKSIALALTAIVVFYIINYVYSKVAKWSL